MLINSKKCGFTLIELMIVVSILGILAAIVLPEVQGYTQKAKEAAAKDNLRILREAIERYAAEHNGVPPGYNFNDPSNLVSAFTFKNQLIRIEKYLTAIPKNPLNEKEDITVLENDSIFPSEPDEFTGWIYKPATREIRLNSLGNDNQGNPYFEY